MNRLQLQLVLHRLHSLVRAGPTALHNLRLAVELHVAGAHTLHVLCVHHACAYTMHIPCGWRSSCTWHAALPLHVT